MSNANIDTGQALLAAVGAIALATALLERIRHTGHIGKGVYRDEGLGVDFEVLSGEIKPDGSDYEEY